MEGINSSKNWFERSEARQGHMYAFYGPGMEQCPSHTVVTTNGIRVHRGNTARPVEGGVRKTGEDLYHLWCPDSKLPEGSTSQGGGTSAPGVHKKTH